jgi:hypothetical protein
MDEQRMRQIVREEIAYFAKNDKFVFEKPLVMADGRNIQVGATTGTRLGTSAIQKLGFFGKTPVVQRSTIASPSAGTTIDAQSRTAIDAIRQALIDLGLTA